MPNANLFSVLLDTTSDSAKIAVHSDAGNHSYADLHALSGRIANLMVRWGVQPGDRVAVQVEKSAVALATYLATLRVGAIYLPLNTAYTATELEYFIGDAQPRLVICDPQATEKFHAIARGVQAAVLTLAPDGSGGLYLAAQGEKAEFATVERSAEDLAAILYTSGTTGRPKGATLTHGNLGSNAAVLRAAWHYEASDVLVHALPMYHTHGLFVACNLTLHAGASMHLLAKFDVEKIVELMPRSTVLMGVPTFYVRLLQADGLREAAKGMRLFVSGSAPLPAETHAAWSAATGHAILERYGMTETNMNTTNPYLTERRPGTVGMALPGTDVRVVDPKSGQSLPPGEIGTIEVAGPNVFRGYWRMPDKTQQEFRADGYFITGDLGHFDEQGYLHIVGRDKDMIISGGFNVYPIEVETEIDALAGIVESAVIGVPHPDLGEAVVAIVVAEGTALPSARAVRASLGDRLARYKLPKEVIFVDALPRNAMGKVQKAALRVQHQSLFDA